MGTGAPEKQMTAYQQVNSIWGASHCQKWYWT